MLGKFSREVTARNTMYFMKIHADLRRGMNIRRHSGHHVKQNRSGDVLTLVQYLISEGLVDFIAGRSAKEVLDMQEAGGERMNNGEWWNDYLECSPGCGHVMSIKNLQSVVEPVV